jgi:hypothetical protein
MNRHARIEVGVVSPDWYGEERDNLERADWHATKSEHSSMKRELDKAADHRVVAELHTAASFSFRRASRSAEQHMNEFAEDHAKRGAQLSTQARSEADARGLDAYPADLQNTLGVSHGAGPKVGGF